MVNWRQRQVVHAGGSLHETDYRPSYHFTPPRSFMNDPNGLVYYRGEYHLFYQHNPFDNIWGHMSWGHAISPDMVRWQHLPVALYEDNGVMIFSGSAVVDWDNSSDLGTSAESPVLVAIYTGHSTDQQTQNLAYSNDGGRTWTKYAANPVVAINLPNFRDPKVFWHVETGQWVMAIVLSDQRKVRFYGSANLKQWSHLSDFGPAGETSGQWECPDLFCLSVDGKPEKRKWVLKVDVEGKPGRQYFIGQFDGKVFTNDNPREQVLRVDYGQDFYAAQSWSDIPSGDGRRVWIGWMSNWAYANETPTAPWRGVFTIPRTVALRECSIGLRLVQQPIAELKALRRRHFHHCAAADIAAANAQLAVWNNKSTSLEIAAEFTLGTATEFGLKVRQGTVEETQIGYDARTRQVFVDRSRSGEVDFSPVFAGRHGGPLSTVHGKVKLRIFVDSCSVEIFGGEGETVLSELIFPHPKSRGVELYAAGGEAQVAAIDVWTLDSILWRPS